MGALARTTAALLLVLGASPSASAEPCSEPDGGIGVSRIVEIDASAGPIYGGMTKFAREDSFLGPKEVVLTFDDGPIPSITGPILDTLDKFCTKATFFSVGRMALAYPAMSKEVLARGHTLGGHTWSHPFNLKRSAIEKVRDEIERGFAAVTMAAGQPIAPFFRFPGLSDSDPMLGYLQSRGIAAFTVDIISNDSYIGDAKRLTERTIKQVEQRDGGILLFHDIKRATAKALPEILTQLKAKGFKVVHMRAKAPYTPLTEYDAQIAPMMAKPGQTAVVATAKPALIPFTAAMAPEMANYGPPAAPASSPMPAAELPAGPAVTLLTPAPRTRAAAAITTASVAANLKNEAGPKIATGQRLRRQRLAENQEPKLVKVRGWSARARLRQHSTLNAKGGKRAYD